MDDVISVSSGDSDVEVVGSVVSAGPPPLSSDVTVSPRRPVDLIDLRGTFPEQRKRKRKHSTDVLVVIDLTDREEEEDATAEMKTENEPSKEHALKLEQNLLRTPAVLAPQQDCGDLRPELSFQRRSGDIHPCDHKPVVQLRRLLFLETCVNGLKTSESPVHFTKDCTQKSPSFIQLDMKNEAPDLKSHQVPECLLTEERQENSRMSQLDSDTLSDKGPVSLDPGVDPPSTSERTQAEVERPSNIPDSYLGVPEEPLSPASHSEDTDDRPGDEAYRGDLETDSPLSFFWQDESDEVNEDNRFHNNVMAASEEDKHFVCPDALKAIMSGSYQGLINVEYEALGTPEMLCRQSLSQVYTTIEEDYPEGTLELLSDLLQPGFYPPRDVSTHLLCNILLNLQRPHHLCVQAFNLLMRTQRHHMADTTTVPWEWELLTSVMANQDNTVKHQSQVVRMFLEYVVQTLEDDFRAQRSVSALHRSITKATLSCDQQFTRVRDVIKWLFSAIVKSTKYGENRETVREKDEHIRMALVFQRMLSLSLEVDNSPTLSSNKLARELFHMLITREPIRAHRMLLLESLKSKMLTCKLLQHLLEHACVLKSTRPMSLSLLLHFLKNCTLAPEPTDGDDRWKPWEELVHLLWMFLLSYNVAMKDLLCSSDSKQRERVSRMVYKQEDKISRSATREAVDAFLSRSQADLGQALPLHVQESLDYLQNQLLDVCHC